MSAPSFSNIRVFIAEDEALIAMFLEEMLMDEGCEIVGPYASFEKAIDAAREEAIINVAMLDVNLGRDDIFPVADILMARNIPIVFMTGYGFSGIPAKYGHFPVLTKPYTATMLMDMLCSVVGDQRVAASGAA